MPIKPEMRGFYPNNWNWPEISRRVRFERAAGICQGCGRPHGMIIRCLPDGRWFDSARHTWRNGRGRPARWPNLEGSRSSLHPRARPVTRRSDEAIVEWQHDDAEPDEAAHDRLSHICITPLQADAGVPSEIPW